jgi:hypothetical protein
MTVIKPGLSRQQEIWLMAESLNLVEEKGLFMRQKSCENGRKSLKSASPPPTGFLNIYWIKNQGCYVW